MSIDRCCYSWDHYKSILQYAKEAEYKFVMFDEAQQLSDENYCLLRHDIDYCPERALRFGRIEAELGIRSTYFFQLVSWTYNVRARDCYEVTQSLKEMGHAIGLHFDFTWWSGKSIEELVEALKFEKKILSQLVDSSISETVSFHNPGTYRDQVIGKKLPGIHHTYEPRYFSEFKYLSDSQGWYEGCVCEIFKQRKYPRIQLLTHPYIWSDNSQNDFIQDMAEIINARRDELMEYMIKFHPVCNKQQDRLRNLVK